MMRGRAAAVALAVTTMLVGGARAGEAAPAWTVVASPNGGAGINLLQGVSCVTASDCWAVGSTFNAGAYRTIVEHDAGDGWRLVDGPNPGASNVLHAVACPAANDCTAVGYDAPVTGGAWKTLIAHYDGRTWAIVPSPPTGGAQVLEAISCRTATDCWAVGGPGPLVEHDSGSGWKLVSSAQNGGELTGVACGGPDDCWGVGNTALVHGDGQPLIMHGGSSGWTAVAAPSLGAAEQGGGFHSIACASATECWAVGGWWKFRSPNQTLVERGGATGWSVVNSPDVAGGLDNLRAVACSSDRCRSGGGSSLPGKPLILQESAGTWTLDRTADAPSDAFSLWGLACTPQGQCWAVGQHGAAGGGPQQTLIMSNQGSSSAPVPGAATAAPGAAGGGVPWALLGAGAGGVVVVAAVWLTKRRGRRAIG
ncbi:MAG TPA: hypothetical protein VFC09_15015 [Candidatus Dormibacteraeota bacterium]|nr:hypothetical protein [Candidatus Dormibacteraeota bacterium]